MFLEQTMIDMIFIEGRVRKERLDIQSHINRGLLRQLIKFLEEMFLWASFNLEEGERMSSQAFHDTN